MFQNKLLNTECEFTCHQKYIYYTQAIAQARKAKPAISN